MAYPTAAVANAFIDKALAGQIDDLSPMKLQKLIFFVQSWHLKIYDEPLVDEFFAKWPYGPVIPSLYHDVKSYGSRPITTPLSTLVNTEPGFKIVTPKVPEGDNRTNKLIDKIVSVYGPLRGTQLSYLTHLPGTAWSRTEKDGAVIDNQLMKECIE
ncbi:Panacea domain-containing protein [Serratia quinivorans]|uniref:Panacea domain-containing protein n=1 Tax=Serratia quinivorans TaxID=137545 RepID=UPI002E788FB2|nr:type II toxin-antitoxin system antitoxin SocA domain-containing protein [Serratia quinivorans]